MLEKLMEHLQIFMASHLFWLTQLMFVSSVTI